MNLPKLPLWANSLAAFLWRLKGFVQSGRRWQKRQQFHVSVLPRQTRLLLMALLTALLLANIVGRQPVRLSLNSPAIAQPVRTQDIWRQVYQQLPDLPLENQYVSQLTGEVAKDNTLVDRLIRYHFFVKGRPGNFRLDWKLTLADYLGANELMNRALYPGAEQLRPNPMDGDRAAIARLNRAQRDVLVQVIVRIFNTRI